jgi:hypothetical protein
MMSASPRSKAIRVGVGLSLDDAGGLLRNARRQLRQALVDVDHLLRAFTVWRRS